MKKSIVMFLGALMILGLTACGGQKNENGGGSSLDAQTSGVSTEAESKTETEEEADKSETERTEIAAELSGGTIQL